MKGILTDEYGFRPERNRWVIGGLDHPAPPFEFTSHPHPEGFDLTTVPEGRTLSGMLDSGEIEALFTPMSHTAFHDAKEAGAERYRKFRRLYQTPVMVPWLNPLMEQNDQLLGEDWWPYGVSANWTALDTFLRYHHEQGLSARRWTVEEIFAHDLLDT